MKLPKSIRPAAFALLFAIALFAKPCYLFSQEQQTRAVIRVDVQQEKYEIPSALSGIFMEEINHAFDGGLYAELIRNRAFEEGIVPDGMMLVENEDGSLRMELESLPKGVPEENWPMPWPWNGNCGWDPDRALIGWSLRSQGVTYGSTETDRMVLTRENPLNQARTYSLELEISPGNGEEELSLINSGYWGINVVDGTEYDLNFYLRPSSFGGELNVALEDAEGKELVVHSFGWVEPADEWRKFSARLRAKGSCPEGQFVMTFKGKGRLQVDWVSLFPPTYKNREHGLRKDLAEYLEKLRPDFVRYPGGCYTQGLSWESAPDWRNMVKPHVERPGEWGYWQYRSTDGFGYHEFLQFCEDIGSDAMYVAFAGMTVHPDNNWPLEDIDTIIQQSLDAIEYAIGPVESKWGAVRAEMGHPDPFPLKYIQIGNEHPPAVYGDYYVKFREAIKEKYPDMTVIMSMYWSGLNWPAIERAGNENIDMVDEHAYRNPDWIRSNFDYFDNYERTPWGVYVGEYASQRYTGDLYCALSDAAYIMMMEENGDIVKMASYAPLFVNVNDRSWNVNLIEFDASRSFANTAYYVQKTFNEHRADVSLESDWEVSAEPDPDHSLMAGRIGLGSWNTQNEFRDLRIYDESGDLIYSEDFNDLENWEISSGEQWQVNDGILQQMDPGVAPAAVFLNEPGLSTGKVTLKARKTGGEEGFLLLFNVEGRDRWLFCNYGAAGNSFSEVQARGTPEGFAFRSESSTRGGIDADQWYDITLVVEKNRAEMYLDGEKLSAAHLVPMESFFATAGYDRDNEFVIIRAVNYNPEPAETGIHLEGTEWVGSYGQHIVISSGDLRDKNSLENPRKVVPREKILDGCSESFTVSLPPYSVNVLKIPVKRSSF